MVFSSLLFTFIFLPIVLLLYFIAQNRYRNYILLISSLLFYAYGEPKFVLVMVGSILLNYGIGILIDIFKKNKPDRAKIILLLGIVVNMGLLFVYKYLDFSITVINKILPHDLAIKNIVLPIGISFFTFQALSYVMDVYWDKVKVQRNLGHLMLYVSFFPQLIAGPIVRYSTIEQQIVCRKHTVEGFGEGCRRFFLGFIKKVLLSNNLSVIGIEVFGMREEIATVNPLLLWLGAICYSLQIYYDFSGYSDMAIGLGKMFGFEFEENFDYPYISKSVTEFWRRWHISLSQWFRDYVYIPLGGSRVTLGKHIFNLLIVWGFTGLWHGANYTFIAWGLGYFILLVIEKFLVRPEKRKNLLFRICWQIITLLCVNFGWVIFNSATLADGIRYCLAMIGYYGTEFKIDVNFIRYIREYGMYIIFGIVASTPIFKVVSDKLEGNQRIESIKRAVTPIVYGMLFLWSVSFLILGAHNPFIYFNF